LYIFDVIVASEVCLIIHLQIFSNFSVEFFEKLNAH